MKRIWLLYIFFVLALLPCAGEVTTSSSVTGLVHPDPRLATKPRSLIGSSVLAGESVNGTPSVIKICSFNIQFLGMSVHRDNEGLAAMLKDFDIVIIQELVAPPYAGVFPNGEPFKPDPQARAFFDEMNVLGFNYVLSPEDTGSGNKIHLNSSATEWWVAFYKPQKVSPANDLPGGFLADDRSNNPDFERVPYAFPFRAKSKGIDFVLISVHLQPNSGAKAQARRQHELAAIAQWITSRQSSERDYIVAGDTNIEGTKELSADLPTGWRSLNENCIPTNTNPNGPKPYDQVMYNPRFTAKEIENSYGFQVVNLAQVMESRWPKFSPSPYPGRPYQHDKFRAVYSDHNPVSFELVNDGNDDD